MSSALYETSTIWHHWTITLVKYVYSVGSDSLNAFHKKFFFNITKIASIICALICLAGHLIKKKAAYNYKVLLYMKKKKYKYLQNILLFFSTPPSPQTWTPWEYNSWCSGPFLPGSWVHRPEGWRIQYQGAWLWNSFLTTIFDKHFLKTFLTIPS